MKVHELLSSPDKWIQRANAFDRNGKWVTPCSDAAVCWCLLGAVYLCYVEPVFCNEVLRRIGSEVGLVRYESVTQWNDAPEREWEDVVAVAKKLDV